jgi:hypothetical protein
MIIPDAQYSRIGRWNPAHPKHAHVVSHVQVVASRNADAAASIRHATQVSGGAAEDSRPAPFWITRNTSPNGAGRLPDAQVSPNPEFRPSRLIARRRALYGSLPRRENSSLGVARARSLRMEALRGVDSSLITPWYMRIIIH